MAGTSLVDRTDQNHLLYCSYHSETSSSEHGFSMHPELTENSTDSWFWNTWRDSTPHFRSFQLEIVLIACRAEDTNMGLYYFPNVLPEAKEVSMFLAVFWGVWDGMKRCTKSHHTSLESLQARSSLIRRAVCISLSWGIQCTPCSSMAPSWTTSRSFAMRCSDAQMYCWFANLLVSGRATLNKFCSQFLQLIHECAKDELTNDPMTWLHTIILRKCHDFLDSTHVFWVHFFTQKTFHFAGGSWKFPLLSSDLCIRLTFCLHGSSTASLTANPWVLLCHRRNWKRVIVVAGGMVESTNQEENYRWVPWKTYKSLDESQNKECDVMGGGCKVSCRFRAETVEA